jgi:hypothetical protein
MDDKNLKTTTLTDQETAEYNKKAEELAKQLGHSKVHPVVFIHPETKERSVCYLAEPNFTTKLAIMDKSLMIGVYQAGEELMRLSMIKEASDECMYNEHPMYDDYRMGVVDFCLTMVSRFQNQFKKK